MQITLEIDDTTASLLATLSESGSVTSVVETLIDHAAQGVYRPGAWEREWTAQVFGYDFVDKLEPGDPETSVENRGTMKRLCARSMGPAL
jgi:hypothetical protein